MPAYVSARAKGNRGRVRALAPKARALTAKVRTEQPSIAAMCVFLGYCPRDEIPVFTVQALSLSDLDQ
jgi:hypothetical protein